MATATKLQPVIEEKVMSEGDEVQYDGFAYYRVEEAIINFANEDGDTLEIPQYAAEVRTYLLPDEVEGGYLDKPDLSKPCFALVYLGHFDDGPDAEFEGDTEEDVWEQIRNYAREIAPAAS